MKALFYSLQLLLLVLLGGYLSTRLNMFRLDEIKIESSNETLDQQVKHTLLRHLGRSLFGVSLKEVQADLHALRYVKSVSLRRQWPSTLVVVLDYREAAFLIRADEKLLLVDDEGVCMGPMKEPRALPQLRGFSKSVGNSASCDGLEFLPDILARTMEWWRAAESKSRQRIDELHWIPDSGLELLVDEARYRVSLGHRDFSHAWMSALNAIEYAEQQEWEVQYFDASYRHRVVATLNPQSNPLKSKSNESVENLIPVSLAR